jgi:uncharacterized membrane protein
MNAAKFDILGIFAFLYTIIVAILILFKGAVDDWFVIILLIVGIVGLIVDIISVRVNLIK